MSDIEIKVYKEIKNKTILSVTRKGKIITFCNFSVVDSSFVVQDEKDIQLFESVISKCIEYIYINSIILFGKQLSKTIIIEMLQKYIYLEDIPDRKILTFIGFEITNNSKIICVFR